MRQEQFHISFGKKRTTITVDIILSNLMAVKLGLSPESSEAKLMVKEWLQATLTDKLGTDASRKNASQWARKYLIEEVADKKLIAKLLDHELR